MNRIAALLIVFSVILCIPLSVHAHDVPQDRNDCSIEVIVSYDGENISGGTLTAVKVGYVDEDDGNYFFSQEITGLKLDDITSPGAPETQKDFYNNNKRTYGFYTQTQPVTEGKATFSDLPTGLYLIVQDEAADGFSKLGAFLVSVPYLKEGAYQYHVTASIKSELAREPETEPPTEPPVKDPSLPQTGQLNWPIPLMAVAGLALFIAGWVLLFGKKRGQHEK